MISYQMNSAPHLHYRAVPFKCRTEKPTAILVGIVVVFVLCHSLRFW